MAQEPEFLEEASPDERSVQERLLEYVAVLWKRRGLILITVAVAVLLAALYSVLREPSYLSTTVLAVDRDLGSPLDPNWHPQLFSASLDPGFLPTQAKLLQSREIAERVVRKLNLLENPTLNPGAKSPPKDEEKSKGGQGAESSPEERLRSMAGYVRSIIDVDQIRGANLLTLSCEAPSPQLASDIANAVADSYIDWNLEAKSEMVTRASGFFDAQTRQSRKELDSLEQQLLFHMLPQLRKHNVHVNHVCVQTIDPR